MRASMIFYASWKEAIKGLPDNVRLEVYEAAIDFAMTGEEPGLSDMAALVFPFIKQDIVRDMVSYDKLCERNRKNGVKGGRPRKNPENPMGSLETQENPTKPKETQKTQANPNDDISKDISLSNKEKNSLQSSQRKSAEADPSAPVKGDSESLDFRKLADFFNSELRKRGSIIPTVRGIDGQRRTSTQARIREHGKDAFAEAVRKAAASDFLNGRNDRGWVADYDWMVKPGNFVKVLEGNYDNRQQQTGNNRYGNPGKHNRLGKGGDPEDGYETSL